MGLKGTFDNIIGHIHNDYLNSSTECKAHNISVASKEISNEMCECVYPGLFFLIITASVSSMTDSGMSGQGKRALHLPRWLSMHKA